jgi:hypothetical protein
MLHIFTFAFPRCGALSYKLCIVSFRPARILSSPRFAKFLTDLDFPPAAYSLPLPSWFRLSADIHQTDKWVTSS